MSEWGTVISALETIARATFPKLRAGTAGFERGVRPVEILTAAELPHVFAHNPQERVTKLDHGQEAVEFSVVLLYAPEHGTSQEDVAVLLDLFRTSLQANPTLTSAVEKAYVRERGVRENPENSAMRAGVLEVVAEWVK